MTEPGDGGAPSSASWGARLAARECPAFGHRRRTRPGGDDGPTPVVLARGEGTHLFDVDGGRYLDLCAGFGAVVLGHGHPRWRAAVTSQLDVMVQGMGDVYATAPKVDLLERLAALHPCDDAQVLLAQSGGDAVTAAIKTAVLATGRPRIVAFDGAYHGLGYAPLAACGFKPSFRTPFSPHLGDHVAFAPFPSPSGRVDVAESLRAVAEHLAAGDVAAVLVEPVLGRGGCVVPPDEFLVALGAVAHRHGALVIADEVWTGIGRAGALSRMVALDAPVDVLCLGKALGGGLSIAAAVASADVMSGWASGGEVVHTSTHVGAPLPCAAALATLDILGDEDLVTRSERVGRRWRTSLRERLGSKVRDVRGAGLMVGIELTDAASAQKTTRALLAEGFVVLTGGVDGATLTLTPPLTISESDLTRFDAALDANL
ncbi:MAG: aspartate aminotransferase family protein [Myxococcota bacterium]